VPPTGSLPSTPGSIASQVPPDNAMCIAPWVHLAVAIGGAASPCCLFDGKLGDARAESIPDIWNGAGFRELRAAMLSGARDQRCRRCFEAEETGGMSLREQFNTDLARHMPRTRGVRPDDPVAPPPPISLDIRFDNLCNFTCRTCYHGASSKWFTEAKRMNWAAAPDALIESFNSPADGVAALSPLLDQVESIYWAGGEPLLQEQHYVILRRLIDLGRTDVALSYNTNLSNLRLGQRDLFELWSHFPKIFLEISIDGAGARGELIREGLDWSSFTANLARVRSECPHIRIGFGITVSVFNVAVVTEFYNELMALGQFDPNGFHFHVLLTPTHYSIQILPAAMKAEIARRLRDFAATLPAGTGPASATGERALTNPVSRQLLHVADHMMAADRSAEVEQFRTVTALLDGMRGRSTPTVCPELAALLKPPGATMPRGISGAIRRRLADLRAAVSAG
jgi:sulfatase maturation enzyme AslB (radical SAM superfamily)